MACSSIARTIVAKQCSGQVDSTFDTFLERSASEIDVASRAPLKEDIAPVAATNPPVALVAFVISASNTLASNTLYRCVAITAQTSSNGVDWGNNTTSGCTSPITVSTTTGYPTGSYVDFRLQMTCSGSTSSSYSDIFSWVTGSGGGGGGGGTGSICSSSWTVRNASCGFGTVNDIGINGFFMNTLSGPSTFPLSSTLYGYKSSPNGVNCTGSNTIQANVTTNLPGTGNCGAMFIYINNAPAPSYTKFFTSDPFPFISGVVINSGDTVEVMISCLPGSCPP